MKTIIFTLSLTLLVGFLGLTSAKAQSPYASSSDFTKYAMKLRENALLTIEPQVFVPTTSRIRAPNSGLRSSAT